MRAFLINLFLLFFSYSAFGIGHYAKGDDVYIWAISGLNLRAKPDAQSSKIINIGFGDKVKVIDNEIHTHPFNYTMIHDQNANWVIEGHWVKVQFEAQIGYVFDGYLSKLPVITNSPQHIPYFNLDLLKMYGEKNWGGLYEETKESSLNFDDNKRDPDKGLSSSYTLTFKDGSYYQNTEESFSGQTSVFIKNIDLEEAYLIFNALTGFEVKQKQSEHKDPMNNRTYLSSVKKDELHFIGLGMSSINISKTEEGVLIQFGGGC